ncbi:MAG: ABC transporter ATP-binding protein [Armatimonadota bacterium]
MTPTTPQPAPPTGDDVVLAARDIRKVFEGQVTLEVLKGITLDFPRGQFASIVGPSGSGKSTLLYILGALDRATSGSVRIGGRLVEELSQSQLASLRNEEIGFVFQFHFLLPEFSAVENVMMPALIGGAERSQVEVRALELLERVGLAHRAKQRSTKLSGGEQQRVAVARALINRPQIVLCDEPTGNLDTRNSGAVYQLLRDLNLENRQTIVVVTHDPEFARKTDRTVYMVDGLVERDELNP